MIEQRAGYEWMGQLAYSVPPYVFQRRTTRTPTPTVPMRYFLAGGKDKCPRPPHLDSHSPFGLLQVATPQFHVPKRPQKTQRGAHPPAASSIIDATIWPCWPTSRSSVPTPRPLHETTTPLTPLTLTPHPSTLKPLTHYGTLPTYLPPTALSRCPLLKPTRTPYSSLSATLLHLDPSLHPGLDVLGWPCEYSYYCHARSVIVHILPISSLLPFLYI